MEQIDLKQLIKQYPEVLTDGTKLKAYILDLYPQCKRGMVNILVAIQQCGIVSEMQASKSPSALDMSRWKKVLDDDYGFTGATAETCLQMWCSAVGITLEIKVNVEAKRDAVCSRTTQVDKQSEQATVSSELQNSQQDWFECTGTKLYRLKMAHEKYRGALYIPNSMTEIGRNAFERRTGLTSVTIPDSVTRIGEWAFRGCTGLISIKIPNSVTTIEDGTFENCTGLASIIIPESVTRIGSWAFKGCSHLTSITIPANVTRIGKEVFNDCNRLSSITVENGNMVYHSQGNCLIDTKSKVLMVGCKTSVIPTDGSVTSICNEAFTNCVGLTSMTIPDGVTNIGFGTFRGCCGLKKIILPSGMKSINFDGCSSLTSVTIPNSVKNIEIVAFRDCRNLKHITIPSSVTSIDERAFEGCSELTSIMIPDSVTSVDKGAFMYCEKLKSIAIPSSVKSIGNCVFHGCTGLTSITIPFVGKTKDYKEGFTITDLFKSWGEYEGKYVPSSLKTIEVTGGTSIGNSAFENCCELTSIMIPDSVTSIDSSAFSNCTGLTSIMIPDSVTNIGSWAFSGCTGLTSITIPSSVTNIGSRAFGCCTKLTLVNFKGTKKQWEAIETEYAWRGDGCTSSSFTVHCIDGDIPYL